MPAFVLTLIALTTLALFVLLRPLWRQSDGLAGQALRRETNLAIFRDQLAELSAEHAAGNLSDADYQLARGELQRRMVDEVEAEQASTVSAQGGSRKVLLFLAIALPLVATAGYLKLGAPEAIDPALRKSAAEVTPEQIESMVEKLAARLQSNPDDNEGWLMLARSYKMQGKVDEAIGAYAKVVSTVTSDPDLLVDYADLLAMKSGGKLDGKPFELIGQALRLDPDHVLALWLAGTHAFNKADYKAAAVFWERALSVLAPDAPDRQMLQDNVAEAQRRAAQRVDHSKAVRGKLSVAAALQSSLLPDDTIFILARPQDGGRMPLAVLKIKAAQLPYEFTLDDRAVLMGDQMLSAQSKVIVEARVSRTGNVIAKEGDLISAPQTVRVGSGPLRLVIDRQRPPAQ